MTSPTLTRAAPGSTAPTTPSRRTVCTAAAAPAWVRAALGGRDRTARVVHRGPHAVYVEADGVTLGVLTTAAALVPCGLRTALPVLPGELRGARTAWIGSGRLLLGDTDVVVTRTVDARVPRVAPAQVAVAAQWLAAAAGGRLHPAAVELPGGALNALGRGSPDAVPRLVGRGSGLTPVGDDVLAGWLATVAAGSADPARGPLGAVAATVARRAGSTTTLSATLLACAARGDVLPEFGRLLRALADDADPDPALDALLRVGHTSGAGLALGALLALRSLVAWRPR